MLTPGRKFDAGSGYRYGFNGKENDKDISSGAQDYGMRIYDARIGKFLSVDPITKQYPELTPYQFASNSPNESIDLDGLESLSAIKSGLTRQFEAQMRLVLAPPKAREIEILVWNPYRNQAQIGKASVVMENIAIARNNYNNAVASNITFGPFGALDYMLYPKGGGFAGAAVDNVVMSFGGISGETTVGVPNYKPIEVELTPVGVEINTKPNPTEIPIVVTIPKSRYPQSAQHIEDATAKGVEPSGVINRQNAKLQRAKNLTGIPTVKGKDRDEFPPAVVTPRNGVSVRHIDPSDNRGSGAHMRSQIDHLPNGAKICFRVTD